MPTGQSTEPKYELVFSHTEVQEMTQMLKISPSTNAKMKKLLSQKLKDAELSKKPTTFVDSYEMVEKEDCLPVCSPVQPHMPPRAFSLDSVKCTRKFTSRSSVPEITQSCKYLSKTQSPNHSLVSCSYQGACTHSTELTLSSKDEKSKKWRIDSRDSGIGHSQDSCDSTESLIETNQVMHREGT